MDALNHKRANKGRNFVRQWRKYRGLTQQQLAEMMSNCVIFFEFQSE